MSTGQAQRQECDRPRILLMVESSRESGRRFIAGIADYAQHFGPWRFHWQPEGLSGLDEPRGRLEFDGVVLRDVADFQVVARLNLPAIVLGHAQTHVSGAVQVQVDDDSIGSKAGDHLLDRGFRHFAFCGYDGIQWSVNREKSFCEHIRRAGGPPVATHRVPLRAGLGYRGGGNPAHVRQWLLSLPKPVGLLAANDDLAEQVVELSKELGIGVPDDCAVVGVDNDPVVCGLSDPPLTSIRVNFDLAGYQAAAILDRWMKGCPPDSWQIVTPVGDLVERQSTNRIAVDDVAVAKALQFIRDRARLPATVPDIARASGVSRRVLEQRFRRVMGCSVLQYHRRQRADAVARLLADTKFALTSIAEQCGFAELSHFTRFFTAVRGVTPSAFRRRLIAGAKALPR